MCQYARDSKTTKKVKLQTHEIYIVVEVKDSKYNKSVKY